MEQPWKIINFICKKISDRMEPSRKIPIEVGQPGLGLHIFTNFTEEKINIAPVNMSKKDQSFV